MKLLIITQKIDIEDSVLGFFHRWVEEFAKNCEKVTVICLFEGEHNLPENVKVLSLGKEKLNGKFSYILNFYKYIWCECKNYDSVFVHMNPIYIVLGGIFWRLWRKKIFLWYTHKQVDLKLRIAEKLAHRIFSASKESFQLKSKKLLITGHGIDVQGFSENKVIIGVKNEIFTIIHVGRITKIKNIDVLVNACSILKRKFGFKFKLKLIGCIATKEDIIYEKYLKKIVCDLKLSTEVFFEGSLKNKEIVFAYRLADVSVNLTPTGGVDKVVLESMAVGVPVFSSNRTFVNYFKEYSNLFIFNECDSSQLAEKIMYYSDLEEKDKAKISDFILRTVFEKASMDSLIKKILREVI